MSTVSCRRDRVGTGGRDVIFCKEGLTQDFDTRLFDPRFCYQIGACRHTIQDAEP